MRNDPAELLRILELVASGQSFAAVASALKLTKAQVAGRIQRAKQAGKTIEALRSQLDGKPRILTPEGRATPPQRPTPRPPFQPKAATPPRPSAVGHTLDEFAGKFDTGTKIQAKVDELLGPDGEQWFHDSDFRAMCNVPVHLWRSAADQFPQFQFVWKSKKLHAWAPVHMVQEFQQMTGHTG